MIVAVEEAHGNEDHLVLSARHLTLGMSLKTEGTRPATISRMKPFRWAPDKNELLKHERGGSFEEITVAVEAGALLEVVPHQNPAKYPRQKIMVVEVNGYAYLVPFVEEDDHFFLKTIIPSRKATRDFIAQESEGVQARSLRTGSS